MQSMFSTSEILIVLPILTTNDMLTIYNPIYNKSNYYLFKILNKCKTYMIFIKIKIL